MGEPVTRSRLAVVDLVSEAWAAIARRPTRSALTALGTIVGCAAFCATLGVAATAGAQISDRFDLLMATEVRLVDTTPDQPDPAFPADTSGRLERLNGVRHAGLTWTLQPTPAIAALPASEPRAGDLASSGVTVTAADPGLLAAVLPTISGRAWDEGHQARHSRVAIVGRPVARQLGITRIDQQRAIFLDGIPFTIIGMLDDTRRNPELLLSIIIPTTTATELFGQPTTPVTTLIDVRPGAAQLIGSQAAFAVHPQDPNRLQTLVPPEPRTLRRGVEADTRSLYLTLAVLAMAIGTIGITNATLVAVLERTHEIGLRRALGARPRHITGQLLTETALLGTTGGIAGTVSGLTALIIISLSQRWTPTIPAWVLPTTPLLGTVTGLIAGIQPARKATRTHPATSLRN